MRGPLRQATGASSAKKLRLCKSAGSGNAHISTDYGICVNEMLVFSISVTIAFK